MGNKQVNFIALNDGSTINNIQVVVDMEKVAEEVMKKVTTGAAIHVKGLLVESAGSGQAHEIQANEVIVMGWIAASEPPAITTSARPACRCSKALWIDSVLDAHAEATVRA